MGTSKTLHAAARFASFFSGESGEEETTVEFSLPEDINTLTDAEVQALYGTAVEHFSAVYGDGTGIQGDTLETLGLLTEAIETLAGEVTVREEKSQALAAEAKAMADKVGVTLSSDAEGEDTDAEFAKKADKEEEEESDEEKAKEKLAAKRVIKLPAKSSSQAKKAADQAGQLATSRAKDIKNVLISVGDGLGVAAGTGVDFLALGKGLDNRLKSFNLTQYQNAANVGRSIREVGSFASILRESEFTIKNNDRTHIDEVLKAAASKSNMKRNPGSLVASGGWAAPSEILYNEFLQLEATAGGLSTPEVVLARAGVQITQGTSFAEIFAATGFAYTEAEDIAGTYQDDSGDLVEGPKPVYHLDIPEFDEYRLDVYGLIIEAGLLAARGYPEYLADVLRKALVAHYHKMNAVKIGEIAAGSTAISLAAGQAGAVAPVLSALELQATHYRDTHRMATGATLEIIAPFWVTGVVRSDLSRRLGVDLLDVPQARVDGWFAQRNLAPQWVQDYQPVSTTAAADFVAWPTSVQFLMYAAGTWVAGKSDVITLDTLYDSVTLKNNDFTALFTEEGQKMLKIGTDSRKITVPISATGVTHIGDEIAHNGTAA
jgi:hypothetical protein